MSKKKQEQSKSKSKTKTEVKTESDNKFEVKKIDDFQFKCYVKNITE